MQKIFLFTTVFILFAVNILQAQSTGFEIVYNADFKYAKRLEWVQKIRDDWHATGINLRIRWRDVIKANVIPSTSLSNSDCVWDSVDAALSTIASSIPSTPYLDIYIRINMSETNTAWQSTLQTSAYDSMMAKAYDGNIYSNAYTDNITRGPRMFSILSNGARNIMEKFYRLVLDHLNNSPYKNRIKLIVPTFSQDDESDLPSHTRRIIAGVDKDWPESTGFSIGERRSFKFYLIQRYANNINKLNEKWGTYFSSFDQIESQMINWNWHSIGDYGNGYLTITYPKGKKEWVDFKTETLRQFHNKLASIAHETNYNFKYGIQLAPIYLNGAEDRGYYDPTSIFEEADFIIAADGPQMDLNHNWIADVTRSIANYWSFEKNKTLDDKVKFATELSWMDYNIINGYDVDGTTWTSSQKTTGADSLTFYYTNLMNSFYNKGASAIFLSHWGNDEMTWVSDYVEAGTEINRYSIWRTNLGNKKNQSIQSITNDVVYHISFVQGLYIRNTGYDSLDNYAHNEGKGVYGPNTESMPNVVPRYIYPLMKYSSRLPNYISNNAYNGSGDFLTNFMVRNDYTFFSSYYTSRNSNIGIYLTGTSNFIPDDVYEIFMQNSYNKKFIYTTRYESSPAFKEYFTPGLYNEYNEKRVPIRFLWQTRDDLQVIFPNCSLPDITQTTFPWYQNDLSKDIVFWAANNAIQQYRGFSIYDSSSSQYTYDKNITFYWKNSIVLQYDYPDGHYQSNNTVQYKTMLEWAKAHDPTILLPKVSSISKAPPTDYSKLANYSYWPKIITPGSLSKKSGEKRIKKIPIEFNLSQNYPNPFNPSTIINYSLPSKGYVSLKIYDIMGREVLTLVDETKESGNYSVTFNGNKLSSGVYIYTLSSSKQQISKKLLLIK